ncbi:MAG: hypothetical protein E6I29_10905 [Chloroflexi bacterium]|nr:MAG: hypothetical protein E6I29_10905 [Chloroflexota bacterium]
MPFRLRFIPGWKRFLLVLAPIALAIALLVGTYTFRWAGGGAAAPSPDAIAAAGGYSPDADMSRLPNLAGRLRDGEQVKVAFAKTASGTVVVRTNLNQATLEELEAVPGFSVAIAQDCIDYRINFGGFQNTRELVDILGMSETDYLVARRYLTL